MYKIGIITNEPFFNYEMTYEIINGKMEKYFNPGLKFDVHIISYGDKFTNYKTLIYGTLKIHPVEDPFKIFPYVNFFLRNLKRIKMTVEIIKKNKIKLIRAYNSITLGFVGLIACKIAKIPFVVSLHSNYIKALKNQYRNTLKFFIFTFFHKMVLLYADCVIAISPNLIDYAKKHNAKEIICIPNPIEKNKFLVKNEEVVKDLKLKYELINKNIFLFVGRYYDPQKNFERLIHAFRKVSSIYSNTHLLVIGDGGNKRDYFKQLVEDLKLSKKVNFIGRIKQADLINFYHLADFFVFPSLWEGLPNSLVEAMLTKKIILTSNYPVCSYLVNNGECGLIADPYNIDDIVEKMIKLLSLSEEEKNLLAERAFKRAINLFDEDKVYKDTSELYIRLIKKN